MSANKPLLLSDVDQAIDCTILESDQQRAAALSHVQTLRRVKEFQYLRERERLSEKLGPDHPRVVALAERLEINRGLVREVVLETERAKTPIPPADARTWVLHGFVRDQADKGLAKLTIALYDSRERTASWIKELGHVCTDNKGYFKLEASNPKDYTNNPVYLRVLTSLGATLFMDADPLTPKGGQLNYREITISGEPLDCPPPPPPHTSEWIVRGKVMDQTGAALPGLTISLSDEKKTFAARLGNQKTDATGNFVFTYRAADFCDLLEQNPALYLQVTDNGLPQPYTDPATLHFEPGRTENLTITLNIQREELKPWVVRGRITDSAGKALAGYVAVFVNTAQEPVSKLGRLTTNAEGKFEMSYPAKEFPDLIEQKTALFLQVTGQGLKPSYTNPTALVFTPGREENLEIILKLAPDESQTWTVRGQVKTTTGEGLFKYIVLITDREKKFTDRLGRTQTKTNGEFEFIYKAEDFADLIKQNPDLILQVLDPNQKSVYNHKDLLHFEPGKTLNLPLITIKIDPRTS